MKKLIMLLLAATMIFGNSAFAKGADKANEKYFVTDKNGDNVVRFTYDIINGEAVITDTHIYKDNIDLVFPAKLDGYPVKRVENSVVQNDKDRVKSVTFENGIKNVSTLSFSNSQSLESVYFGDSIEELNRVYFSSCPNITSLHLPKALKSGDFHLGNNAVLSIVIPAGLEKIPEEAFSKCEKLKSITIEDGVKEIGHGAFGGCNSLESIALPESITVIDKAAFTGCTALKEINIPKNVKYIGENAFRAAGITKIKLPSGLEGIGSHAFTHSNLTEITIPNSVSTIEEYAFSGCEKLKKLTVSGKTNTHIYAFSGCRALEDVTVNGDMKKSLFEAISSTPAGERYLEKVDGDFVIFDGNYLARYKGRDKNPVIPEGVTTIGALAFQETDIDSVTFPKTKIGEIPKLCFKASQIKEITIPSTVEKIDEMAFYGCRYLEKLTIEEGVKSVAKDAFINCYSLLDENVSIGKKVRVDKYAFRQTPMDKELIEGGGWIEGFATREGEAAPSVGIPIRGKVPDDARVTKFSDMDISENLTLLESLGIVEGYEDGTFRPQNSLTRAEAVKTLVSATGFSEQDILDTAEAIREGRYDGETSIKGFKDYNTSHWANTYLQIGTDSGMISGFDDGTLRPDDKVTMEQLLTMLVNTIGYEEYANAAGGYPNGYVQWAVTTGITEGLDGKRADYVKDATRGEMVTCVANALRAPLCEITSWTILWDGRNAPTLEIKDGTGKNFQNLLSRNYAIFAAEGEITDTDGEAVTAEIYSQNFADEYIEEKRPREINIKEGEENADRFISGERYKLYIKVKDYDEKDYELVCAFPAE